MVPEIVAAVDATLIVDSNNSEELVEEVHGHLTVGGIYSDFQN